MAKIQGKEAFAAVTEAQAEKMFKVETRIYSLQFKQVSRVH